MVRCLFLTTVGTLTLMSLSLSSFAAGGKGSEESKEHGLSTNTVQTEESQAPQRTSPFFSLDLSLFQRLVEFLPHHDVVQLAQVSKYCLESAFSHFNMELSLKNKILTEEDFLSRFGEDGFYKQA